MLCFIIDHELLLRAVRRHVTCQWALLYIERWLTAPMVDEAGARIERSRGTPQRGVVSPILSNTFLNYLQFRYCPPSWGVYETGGSSRDPTAHPGGRRLPRRAVGTHAGRRKATAHRHDPLGHPALSVSGLSGRQRTVTAISPRGRPAAGWVISTAVTSQGGLRPRSVW